MFVATSINLLWSFKLKIMFSRRKFLKIGSLATVGGLMLSGNLDILGQASEKTGYFPIPTEILSQKITLLNQQTFEPLLNASFAVKRENASAVAMRLVEIVGKDSEKDRFAKISTDSFLLIFEVTGKGRLEDKIYEISNPDLGEFPIFLSTVGRSGMRYQAVFNRVYF
jgi:hypothetical protein